MFNYSALNAKQCGYRISVEAEVSEKQLLSCVSKSQYIIAIRTAVLRCFNFLTCITRFCSCSRAANKHSVWHSGSSTCQCPDTVLLELESPVFMFSYHIL